MMRSPFERIHASLSRERLRYRRFKLNEHRADPAIPPLVILEEALALFEGCDLSTLRPVDVHGLEVESRTVDVLTCLTLLKEAQHHYQDTGSFRYNARLISDQPGFQSIHLWFWKPLSEAGLTVPKMMNRYRTNFMFFITQARENEDVHRYIEAQLRPFIYNYLSIIDLLEKLYLSE